MIQAIQILSLTVTVLLIVLVIMSVCVFAHQNYTNRRDQLKYDIQRLARYDLAESIHNQSWKFEKDFPEIGRGMRLTAIAVQNNPYGNFYHEDVRKILIPHEKPDEI